MKKITHKQCSDTITLSFYFHFSFTLFLQHKTNNNFITKKQSTHWGQSF